MATTNVTVDTSSAFGKDLLDAVEMGNRFRAALKELIRKGSHMIDGSDYTLFETKVGLPTGTGSQVFNGADSVVTYLETDTSAIALLERLTR